MAVATDPDLGPYRLSPSLYVEWNDVTALCLVIRQVEYPGFRYGSPVTGETPSLSLND